MCIFVIAMILMAFITMMAVFNAMIALRLTMPNDEVAHVDVIDCVDSDAHVDHHVGHVDAHGVYGRVVDD